MCFIGEMNPKLCFVSALLAVALWGCSTPSNVLNNISVGMTKAEVTKIMGTPESTRASQGVEYIVYTLNEGTKFVAGYGVQSNTNKYFVKFVDGRVDSYGRVGDFDSTKPVETKHEIDVKIK
jgi:outer membrane protein assembly factor BamE (lipoprotein component of BamABCDE complex)